MLKHLKLITLIFLVSFLLSGCFGPYADIYNAMKKGQEEQKIIEAERKKQVVEQLAHEEQVMSKMPTTEKEIREKEKVLKARAARDPRYQNDSTALYAEKSRIETRANEESAQLRNQLRHNYLQ